MLLTENILLLSACFVLSHKHSVDPELLSWCAHLKFGTWCNLNAYPFSVIFVHGEYWVLAFVPLSLSPDKVTV